MTDNLVERLREVDAHENPTHAEVDLAEAADRIEALTAERDEAINQLDSATHSVEVLENRVAKFMADNARLTAALTDAGPYLERGLDEMAFNIIRAALKGETP